MGRLFTLLVVYAIDIELVAVVLVEGQRQQYACRQHEANQRHYLADTEGAPIEAVCPQTLDHCSAQAVPSGIAQRDLTVILALLGDKVQSDEADSIPQRLIEKSGMECNFSA